MPGWECAIVDCGSTFETIEGLVAHQVSDHAAHDCKICGETVPEGYFAIKHGVEDHTRTDFVRHYDADSSAIREREQVLEDVADAIDPGVLEDLLSDERVDALDTSEPAPATTS